MTDSQLRLLRALTPGWRDMPQDRAYDCMAEKWIDPRDDDPTKEGIFRDHRCWKCDDGQRHCPFKGRERDCENLRARND